MNYDIAIKNGKVKVDNEQMVLLIRNRDFNTWYSLTTSHRTPAVRFAST